MTEEIDHFIHWLDGINRSEIPDLQQTNEYNAFINAFQVLEQAHRKAACSIKGVGLGDISDSIVLRICEFLNCFHLVALSETSSRLHSLCNLSAKQRTSIMNESFYLHSYMKLLRAKEQAEGISPNNVSVRVPLFGLEKKIIVSECGDPEFNGIYYCTGSNGNGFLFSKPRFIGDWQGEKYIRMNDGRNQGRTRVGNDRMNHSVTVSIDDEEIFPSNGNDRFLRCIISKRYSNETILWYMSKEVEDGDVVKQEFSFWAKLMTSEEGPPDICIYPSQTSIQSRNGESCWRPLPSHRTTASPVVEILE